MDALAVGVLAGDALGARLVETLRERHSELRDRIGARLRLVVSSSSADLTELRAQAPELSVRACADPYEIVEDNAIGLVVDCSPRDDVADLYAAAITRGKHIVSANLAAFVEHGRDLHQRAQQCHQTISWGGALGDLAPVVRALRRERLFQQTERLAVVVANAVNTALSDTTSPSLSIDTPELELAGRAALLASEAFGQLIEPASLAFSDPTEVAAPDHAFASQSHLCIRQVLEIERRPEGLAISIEPALVADAHPLAWGGVERSVAVLGRTTQATRVVAEPRHALETRLLELVLDLVDAARRVALEPFGLTPKTATFEVSPESPPLLLPDQQISQFYVRLNLQEEPGIIARVAGAFSEQGVPVRDLISTVTRDKDGRSRRLQLITERALGRNVRLALERVHRMPTFRGPDSCLRIIDS